MNVKLYIVCLILFSLFIPSEINNRVKLKCNNQPFYFESILIDDLKKQQLLKLVSHFSNHKFNCARLVWLTYLVTS